MSLGERAAVVLEHGVVAVRKTPNEVISTSKLCSLYAVFVSGVKTTVANVVQNGAREEVNVLKNNAKRATQRALLNLVDVDAVVANLTVFNVIEAVEQVSNGCFTCTCCTNKGNLLTRFCINRNIMQYGVAWLVAKVNIKETNVTLDWSVGNGVIAMWILPSPVTGAVLSLLYLSIDCF